MPARQSNLENVNVKLREVKIGGETNNRLRNRHLFLSYEIVAMSERPTQIPVAIEDKGLTRKYEFVLGGRGRIHPRQRGTEGRGGRREKQETEMEHSPIKSAESSLCEDAARETAEKEARPPCCFLR